MIHINPELLKDTEIELLIEDFNTLIDSFKDKYPTIYDAIKSDDKEYDLSKKYQINHVCGWNAVLTYKAISTILAKNDKIALVVIHGSDNEIMDLYRLEDLTLIN